MIDEDAYEQAKRSMVACTYDQYYSIYLWLHDDLAPYETFTNTEDNERFGVRQIYTLWGLRGKDVPVISSHEYRDELTFKANPEYL